MSELFKLKYEVVAILQENILKGLASFGVPLKNSPSDNGWIVMESDQPSFKNADNVVLFSLEDSERIGWQSDRRVYNKETKVFDIIETFIDQQTWKIRVLTKRTTAPITDDAIPFSSEDVADMLIAWFNRLGCMEFRKHNMANLFVQTKDVRTYKDKSDVNQWTTEFPLKVQVVKQFETEIGTAVPQYKGAIGLSSTSEGELENENNSENTTRNTTKPPLIRRLLKRIGVH